MSKLTILFDMYHALLLYLCLAFFSKKMFKYISTLKSNLSTYILVDFTCRNVFLLAKKFIQKVA